MKISKKLYTTLIITILTVSTLIVAIPMASAISAPTFIAGYPPAPTIAGPVYTKGDVTGTGATFFGKVEVYWDTLGTKIAEGYADGSGNYEIEITIPEDVAGDHNIIVYDVLASDIESMIYEITPSIMPLTTKALPGDSVTVMGSGFGEELPVQIYLGTIVPVTSESVALSGTPAAGIFAHMPVVITTVTLTVDVTIDCTTTGAATGTTAVTVTDDGKGHLLGKEDDVAVTDGSDPGEVNVTVTGTINYITGGITLTATGVDSAGANPATAITVTVDTPCSANYSYAPYVVTPTGGAESSELGSFMATIVVPAIAEGDYGDYAITAVDSDTNVAEYVAVPPYLPGFRVDYYLTLSPATGPTGITSTIAGRIESGEDYEIRFGAATIATGTSGSNGAFTAAYLIPDVLPPNTYTVTIVWQVTKTKTATFTVTNPPELTSIVPPSGQPGDVIVISGERFTAGATIELYLGSTLVNSTAMDERFGPTGAAMTAIQGKIIDLEFTVPDIAAGVYVLKVVDENGASTGNAHTFVVSAAPESTIGLRGTSYYTGDTISFNIVTTESSLTSLTVTVYDPSSVLWWTAVNWPLSTGVVKQVAYYNQTVNGNYLTLPADAPLGNWNWTITYTPASTGKQVKVTGLFAVAAKPTMQAVIDTIYELGANLTEINDGVASIETAVGEINVALDALDATITSFDGDMATIKTNLGTVQTTVSGLNADITAIKTSVSSVSNTVSSIDQVVAVVVGDTTAIKTSLGTLEGTITDITDDVATIQTDVGTLKVDVASIKTDVASVQSDVESALPIAVDMMPVWIAVVLSLIAAIAAIFAVVTIRQKIAG
jgi:archaellum component FlaC